MDKKWSDRMEMEDKTALSKYETWNSVVQRHGQEVLNLREKNGSEKKGWGVWKDTRGTGHDEDEVKALATHRKTTMPVAKQDKFDWGLTSSSKLWPSCGSSQTSASGTGDTRLRFVINELKRQACRSSGFSVRAVWVILSDRRPWNKAQAFFLRAMREIAGLGRQVFDIT